MSAASLKGDHAVQKAIRRAAANSAVALIMASCVLAVGHAQGVVPGGRPGGPPGAAPGAPPSARDQAPFDPTGYWVSVVTQDWRYRMVVPPPGYYAGIPLTIAAKQFADSWDRAAYEAAGKQCEAYGGAIIMRVPTRLRVSWQDASTLVVETDAGTQTRVLHFAPDAAAQQAAPSLQGYSTARWQTSPPARGAGPPQPGAGQRYGSLQVTTTRLTGGLLRTNGVPYSDRTSATELWDVNTDSSGDQWLTVSLQIADPLYLRMPYVVTANFQKQRDGTGWDPTACTLR